MHAYTQTLCVCVCFVAEREYVAGSIESSRRESRCEKQGSQVREKEARESSQSLMNSLFCFCPFSSFYHFSHFLSFSLCFSACVFAGAPVPQPGGL